MEAGSTALREEGCTHCCKGVSMGSVAFFCSACGRQVKPVPEGKFAFRAAEGSAEKAWKAFGFADAHASSKRARAATIGNDSAKRAANLALATTRSIIEQAAAPPTLEQARVMGVESVVEGIDWNFSTDQLQVLALARSGALRGRRRVPPSALPQTSSATPKTAATTKTEAPKLRVAKGKSRDGRANHRKNESRVDQTNIGNERPEQVVSTQRSSGRRRSNAAPEPAGASDPPKKGPGSFPAALKKQRHLQEAGETQEQLVAVARGGVRHAGKVFHTRGVKLTEDSPRSMVPRDAFRASGSHLLSQKDVSICRNGRRGIYVAQLSAVVRAVPVDTEKVFGLCEEVPSFRRSQPPPGAHLAESSFVCDGARLEIRPLRWRCQALQGDCVLDAKETACLEHANQFSSSAAKVGAAAEETLTAFRDEIRGSSSSSSSSLEERPPHRGVEEDGTAHAGELLPQVPSSLPTSTAGLADEQHDCPAASASGGCHQRSVPVVFFQDFTHVELDALLGPTLPWKDPFEENKRTVGGLEASWAACLDSLCGRLRAIVPETDDGRLPGEGEGMTTSEGAIHATVVAEKPGTFPGSTYGPRKETEGPQEKQRVEVAEGLAGNTDVETQGSPVVPVPAVVAAKTGHPAGVAVAPGGEQIPGRAVQALPLVRRRKAGCGLEEDAREGVWLDKVILRVGARVPWGRLHRGRFAKVLFTVSLGKDCNGVKFAATSNSPTADPMLRGRWDFRATDQHLARYLSSGYAAVHGSNSRGRPHKYDPRRCANELQGRGELEWACAVIARTAFRFVLVAPGGVVLSLAGVAIEGGREVAWPQDVEEDRVLNKASSDVQRAWRGCSSRKRTRWLRMEREGRRRLSRIRKEAEDERQRARLLEEEAKAKLALEEERRVRAQTVLAAATRGQAARLEASRRRGEQRRLDQEAAVEREEAEKAAEAAAAAAAASSISRRAETAESEPRVEDDHEVSTTVPGMARLDRVVTIDGTEVHLTAHVKEAGAGGGGESDQPMEMLLVAVDRKARRSSRLSLDAADIGEIVGARQAGKGGSNVIRGAQGALSAVMQKLTLFNSRRKDLFILSYRGKKVVAPH